MATDEPVTPSDRDLSDVTEAIVHLYEAIGVLAGSLPPGKAKQLVAHELSIAKSAIGSIIKRHDPQSVEFGENDDGCVTFITDLPVDFRLSDPPNEGTIAVSLGKPFPPAPPRPPGTK